MLILFVLSVFFVFQQSEAVSQTAIASYQQTELAVVREAARGMQEYVAVQTEVLGRTDIENIEQEALRKFIEPIHLLENGDAWIYAPDHVVFDQSSDFPDIYRGKSMAEIFAIQAEQGASHFEEMTADVANVREGSGWYIWLPEKGAEIAAWTPVHVGNYSWTIGLSTPLPEILEASGAAGQSTQSLIVLAAGILLALALCSAWVVSDIKRVRAEQALQKANNKLHLLSSMTRHDTLNRIMVLGGYLELARESTENEPARTFLIKMDTELDAVRRQILFTREYQQLGILAPVWQDAGAVFENVLHEFDLSGVAVSSTAGGLLVSADPLFERVLYNLVENSLRHGGTVTRISLDVAMQPSGAVLIYEDDGVGVPEKIKEQIFRRGFGSNTGFGLFLSREILEITGITIRETGVPGEGVRFEMNLPPKGWRRGA
ncbi:HAMP domain-containing histidine kinase [Methanoculleus sp. FWC-SCC1]|uniref:histidine kinase n=1 Tax=Methanoculleus frigidifontis TaxID=2584085 RepID=A0ABT8M8S8_9EURY|nr:HAMP domain-containing sensor histidine kinase [Methanoculleus sp. FWC-SCC1]MDN7024341.1 HAMP domain-containing histidine kinase [Methanoculleus sp. FWC-SCC1]